MASKAASSTRSVVLEERYRAADQHHVFEYYDELTKSEQQDLLSQLQSLPPVDDLTRIFVKATASSAETATSTSTTTPATSTESNIKSHELEAPPSPPPSAVIEPFQGAMAGPFNCRPPLNRSTDDSNDASNDADTALERVARYRRIGLHAISQGHVAAVVMAGGQGTRLGYDGPKGLYNIGLPSGMSLFELQARRIAKLQELAAEAEAHEGASNNRPTPTSPIIPFYVMTSPLNHDATVQHFEMHNYFGLSKHNVFFFRQGVLPCFDLQGKIIMESKGRVAVAPNGNGGIYPSLEESGALQDMLQRGVTCMNVFSVDNALIRPADPVFVGYCMDQQADVGNKVVSKLHPHEKVGVLALKDGKPCVVEYSEITTTMAEQVNTSGQLAFGAANIANHYFTVEFIRDQVLTGLQDMYHAAHKKIPYWDADQNATVTPSDASNGIKLEAFIFDAFALSTNMAVLHVERDDEFAPVKNATGSDSPESARQLLSQQARRWIMEAGGTLKEPKQEEEDGNEAPLLPLCEIVPSTSYAGEGLERLVQERGGVVECPFVL